MPALTGTRSHNLLACYETNDVFHFKGKTRGAFMLPKGARNVFVNESEDTRNVLGEFQQVCEWWTSIKDRDFAAIKNLLVLSFWKQWPFVHITAGTKSMCAIRLYWGVFSPEQKLPVPKLLCQLRRWIWTNDCFQYISYRLPQWGGKLVFIFFPFLYSLPKHFCSAKWSKPVVICDVHRCKQSVCVSAKVTCFCLFFPHSSAPAAAAAAHLAKVTLRCFIFLLELDMWSSKKTRPPLKFLVSVSSWHTDTHVRWTSNNSVHDEPGKERSVHSWLQCQQVHPWITNCIEANHIQSALLMSFIFWHTHRAVIF